MHASQINLLCVVHSPWHHYMGCGVHPPNVISKVEWNKDLALIIWRNQSTYTKVLKGAWDIKNWKKAFSKILWHQEIYVFTQYYDSPRDLLVYTIPCIIDDSWPINKFLHIQNQRYWNTWYIVLIRVFAFIIRFETTLKKVLWSKLCKEFWSIVSCSHATTTHKSHKIMWQNYNREGMACHPSSFFLLVSLNSLY